MDLRKQIVEKLSIACITILNIGIDTAFSLAFITGAAIVEKGIQFLGFHNEIITTLQYWVVQPIFFIILVSMSIYHIYLGCFPPREEDSRYDFVGRDVEQQPINEVLVAPTVQNHSKPDTKEEK